MDGTTIAGLLAGAAILIVSLAIPAGIRPFFDVPSLLLVIGGTLCAAMISFPARNLLATLRVIKKCFRPSPSDPRGAITELVRCAQIARRDGILALDRHCKQVNNPFLVHALQLAVDGVDPVDIESALTGEIESIESRHEEGRAVLEHMARYAPAFGMIGTLIGLVVMLTHLNDPRKIGPSLAVALLTTLYGACLAHLVFGPLAEKLALRTKEELTTKWIILRGVLAIQSGDHPSLLERKLETFLPPPDRRTRKAA